MKRLLFTLSLAVVATAILACGGSGSSPAGSVGGSAAAPGEGITVVAKDIAFKPTTITAPAGKAFTIAFDNQESVPHNIAISDASGATVFKGEIVTGTKVTYNVNALPAGTYPFKCEVHPNMTGTLAVQ